MGFKSDIRDLLYVNQKSKEVSHNKLHSNIGYMVCHCVFVYMALNGLTTEIIWLTYGGMVLGTATMNKFISYKHGQGADKSITENPNASSDK